MEEYSSDFEMQSKEDSISDVEHETFWQVTVINEVDKPDQGKRSDCPSIEVNKKNSGKGEIFHQPKLNALDKKRKYDAAEDYEIKKLKFRKVDREPANEKSRNLQARKGNKKVNVESNRKSALSSSSEQKKQLIFKTSSQDQLVKVTQFTKGKASKSAEPKSEAIKVSDNRRRIANPKTTKTIVGMPEFSISTPKVSTGEKTIISGERTYRGSSSQYDELKMIKRKIARNIANTTTEKTRQNLENSAKSQPLKGHSSGILIRKEKLTHLKDFFSDCDKPNSQRQKATTSNSEIGECKEIQSVAFEREKVKFVDLGLTENKGCDRVLCCKKVLQRSQAYHKGGENPQTPLTGKSQKQRRKLNNNGKKRVTTKANHPDRPQSTFIKPSLGRKGSQNVLEGINYKSLPTVDPKAACSNPKTERGSQGRKDTTIQYFKADNLNVMKFYSKSLKPHLTAFKEDNKFSPLEDYRTIPEMKNENTIDNLKNKNDETTNEDENIIQIQESFPINGSEESSNSNHYQSSEADCLMLPALARRFESMAHFSHQNASCEDKLQRCPNPEHNSFYQPINFDCSRDQESTTTLCAEQLLGLRSKCKDTAAIAVAEIPQKPFSRQNDRKNASIGLPQNVKIGRKRNVTETIESTIKDKNSFFFAAAHQEASSNSKAKDNATCIGNQKSQEKIKANGASTGRSSATKALRVKDRKTEMNDFETRNWKDEGSSMKKPEDKDTEDKRILLTCSSSNFHNAKRYSTPFIERKAHNLKLANKCSDSGIHPNRGSISKCETSSPLLNVVDISDDSDDTLERSRSEPCSIPIHHCKPDTPLSQAADIAENALRVACELKTRRDVEYKNQLVRYLSSQTTPVGFSNKQPSASTKQMSPNKQQRLNAQELGHCSSNKSIPNTMNTSDANDNFASYNFLRLANMIMTMTNLINLSSPPPQSNAQDCSNQSQQSTIKDDADNCPQNLYLGTGKTESRMDSINKNENPLKPEINTADVQATTTTCTDVKQNEVEQNTVSTSEVPIIPCRPETSYSLTDYDILPTNNNFSRNSSPNTAPVLVNDSLLASERVQDIFSPSISRASGTNDQFYDFFGMQTQTTRENEYHFVPNTHVPPSAPVLPFESQIPFLQGAFENNFCSPHTYQNYPDASFSSNFNRPQPSQYYPSMEENFRMTESNEYFVSNQPIHGTFHSYEPRQPTSNVYGTIPCSVPISGEFSLSVTGQSLGENVFEGLAFHRNRESNIVDRYFSIHLDFQEATDIQDPPSPAERPHHIENFMFPRGSLHTNTDNEMENDIQNAPK